MVALFSAATRSMISIRLAPMPRGPPAGARPKALPSRAFRQADQTGLPSLLVQGRSPVKAPPANTRQRLRQSLRRHQRRLLLREGLEHHRDQEGADPDAPGTDIEPAVVAKGVVD